MAHDQVIGKTTVAADIAHGARFGCELGAAGLVWGQRDRRHHANDFRLTHQRMIGQSLPFFLQVRGGYVADMLDDFLFFEDA